MEITLRTLTPLVLLLVAIHLSAMAETLPPVYRCPGAKVLYTDNLTPQEAEQRGCKPIDGPPTSVQQAPVRTPMPANSSIQACGTTDKKTGRKAPDCIDGDALAQAMREQAERAPKWQPRKLSAVDQWRYESCQQDAAKAPTETGVRVGLRLCREKFGQQPPG